MKNSLREQIYHNIREQITRNALHPGEHLVEAQLASQLNASRSPIREAMRQLESEGLLTFERNKGFTVSKLSRKEVEEIYNLRWLLESYATYLLAERATKKNISDLRGLMKRLADAAAEDDLRKYIEFNELFHSYISEYSGNSNLHITLENLKRRVYRYIYMGIDSQLYDTYFSQHEDILKAIENRDGEMAERYMKTHIDKIMEVMLKYLDVFGS